jgi:hypothetical protein
MRHQTCSQRNACSIYGKVTPRSDSIGYHELLQAMVKTACGKGTSRTAFEYRHDVQAESSHGAPGVLFSALVVTSFIGAVCMAMHPYTQARIFYIHRLECDTCVHY